MMRAVRITVRVQDPPRSTASYPPATGPAMGYRFDGFTPSGPSSAGRGFEPSLNGWRPGR